MFHKEARHKEKSNWKDEKEYDAYNLGFQRAEKLFCGEITWAVAYITLLEKQLKACQEQCKSGGNKGCPLEF